MDDEKVQDGASGVDNLPPEVLHSFGRGLLALMATAFVAGCVLGSLIAVLAVL